jgi:uncharacterized protein YlxP (DUF503 family)
VLLKIINKLIRKILFSVLALSLLSFVMHKYYVSITEADYNMELKTFEISMKFIAHDLEAALESAGVPKLYLGTEKEHKKAADYINQYINQRFHMVVDGVSLNMNFVGKEINNDDFMYCFFESDSLETPKKITIKNTLLTEIFSEQANTVYLRVGDQKVNYQLNKSKVSETHEL